MRAIGSEQIIRALPMGKAIAAMREAFAARVEGRADEPPRTVLHTGATRGATLVMPAALDVGDVPLLVVKVVSVFPSNREKGMDSIHGTVIAVEAATGAIELLDYGVVEDCGIMVNPTIVEGQIAGGVAQGIGTALYEEIPYDAGGQPLATTFADYLMPGASEIPTIRMAHMETPTPHTEYGIKGMGEGGAIAPPAAIANAVRDALRAIGAELNETPLTPERVRAAIAAAEGARAGR